ncbi:MAG: serine/threonine protein kinase [Kofleriaceae bacterium]|nr:serine/threonine protein kinase [Kofleriaceae bacterium]
MSQDPPASGAFPSAPPAPSLVGEVLDGRYRITGKIGEGGMGEVWAAEHIHIEKKFAIKLLKSEIISNAEAVTRFRQEARSASSIGHANIIKIDDFGQLPDGRIYMCMELLNGTPLNDLIKTPVAPDRLLNIMIQTGHGLAAAHAKGITHRDMKPENIFVTVGPGGEDVPKLLDFGIAKVAGGEGQNHLTRTGTIFGTPFYMAPEQALGNPVDARTDVYAMGVILYELFAGEVPFGGESFMAILTSHITREPEPVEVRAARAGRQLPPGVAEIIGYCMRKDPAQRYQTMDDLVAAMVASYRAIAGAGMSSYMAAFPVPSQQSQPALMPPHLTGAPYEPRRPGVVTPTGGMPAPGHGAGPVQAPGPGYGQPAAGQAAPPAGAVSQPPYGSYTGSSSAGNYGDADAGASMLAPKKSKAGLFAVLFLVLAGGGGAGWYFVAGPGSKPTQAGAGTGSGTATVAAATNLDAGSAVAVTPDAAVGTGPVALTGVDAPAVVVAAADAAPVVIVDAKPVVVATVHQVLVKVTGVAKFEIYDGDDKLVDGPENVEIVGDSTRTLTLKARGYKDLEVEISGSKPSFEFKLQRVKVTTPTGPIEPPPPKMDCRRKVTDPKNPACRAQFCVDPAHVTSQYCLE